MPLVMICLCFLISVLVKKPKVKKIFFWTGFSLLFFCTNGFFANEAILAWELKAKPFADVRKYHVGIVLTGTTMSSRTPDDRIYFGRGADRVTHTVQLYKLGLIDKILVSGGSGNLIASGEKEAVSFMKAMVLMGVPEQDIVIESETRNTHESAVAVKKILASLGYDANECVLITSAFHMRRSLACYQKEGMALDHFTTDFYSHSRKYTLETFIIPSIEAIDIWHKLIREWTGCLAYKMAGYI